MHDEYTPALLERYRISHGRVERRRRGYAASYGRIARQPDSRALRPPMATIGITPLQLGYCVGKVHQQTQGDTVITGTVTGGV